MLEEYTRIFFVVIEEEGLWLHFDICGLGCFCLLGLVLFADRRKKGIG